MIRGRRLLRRRVRQRKHTPRIPPGHHADLVTGPKQVSARMTQKGKVFENIIEALIRDIALKAGVVAWQEGNLKGIVGIDFVGTLLGTIPYEIFKDQFRVSGFSVNKDFDMIIEAIMGIVIKSGINTGATIVWNTFLSEGEQRPVSIIQNIIINTISEAIRWVYNMIKDRIFIPGNGLAS
jgi:hypothetical protein